MGVCAQQHRVSTGRYNCVQFNKVVNILKNNMSVGKALIITFYVVGLILYMYILCLLMALFIEISLNQTSYRSYPMKFAFNIPASEISPTILIILLIFHLLKTTKNNNPLNQIKRVFCLNTKKYLYFFYSRAAQYTYWVAFLNLFLIVICNPVILNPGPIQGNSKLSVFLSKCKGIYSSHSIR